MDTLAPEHLEVLADDLTSTSTTCTTTARCSSGPWSTVAYADKGMSGHQPRPADRTQCPLHRRVVRLRFPEAGHLPAGDHGRDPGAGRAGGHHLRLRAGMPGHRDSAQLRLSFTAPLNSVSFASSAPHFRTAPIFRTPTGGVMRMSLNTKGLSLPGRRRPGGPGGLWRRLEDHDGHGHPGDLRRAQAERPTTVNVLAYNSSAIDPFTNTMVSSCTRRTTTPSSTSRSTSRVRCRRRPRPSRGLAAPTTSSRPMGSSSRSTARRTSWPLGRPVRQARRDYKLDDLDKSMRARR